MPKDDKKTSKFLQLCHRNYSKNYQAGLKKLSLKLILENLIKKGQWGPQEAKYM